MSEANAIRIGDGKLRLASPCQVFFVGTIPRSGSWLLHNLFHFYASHLGSTEEKLGNIEATFWPNLKKAKLQIHATCPGYRHGVSPEWKDRLDKLYVGPGFDDDYRIVEDNFDLVSPYLPETRIVFLYRNPFDQQISLYQHQLGHKVFFESHSTLTLSDFIHKEIGAYLKLFLSYWHMKSLIPNQILMLNYEALYRDPTHSFGQVLRFLDPEMRGSAHHDAVAGAVRACSIAETQKLERARGHSLAGDQLASGTSHIRHSEPGYWREAMPEDCVRYIRARMAEFPVAWEDWMDLGVAGPSHPAGRV